MNTSYSTSRQNQPDRGLWFVLRRAVTAGAWLVLTALPVQAEVRLPCAFGSHMVLQQERPVTIWGWADVGEQVRVELAEATATARADAEGRWRVSLPAMPSGGPHTMTVAGTNSIRLDDVLIGEVWLCSGQSNMWRPLHWPQKKWGVVDYQREIAAADHPRLRVLNLSRVPGGGHPNPPGAVAAEDATGEWKRCAPAVAANFSATAYYFGRTLLEELNVPVGLINASYGGSKIEAWTPPSGFRCVAKLERLADQAKARGRDAEVSHNSPSALYNSMIHPLVPFELRGFVWYQGESNLGDGTAYRAKMEALIRGWRGVWNHENLPFYYVQLPPFRYGGNPYRLPQLRAAQAAALELPHTGMAVTLDVGDLKDIHPRQKQPVGHRLALLALANDYQRKELSYSGPVFRAMRVEGDTAYLEFDYAADGLASRDGKPLTWFEVAGADGRFVPAEAAISGNRVILHHPAGAEPKAVRFAWHQEAKPNLVNSAGLPAAPFQSERSEE